MTLMMAGSSLEIGRDGQPADRVDRRAHVSLPVPAHDRTVTRQQRVEVELAEAQDALERLPEVAVGERLQGGGVGDRLQQELPPREDGVAGEQVRRFAARDEERAVAGAVARRGEV